MNITIDKGIALPKPRRTPDRYENGFAAALKQMKIGDSFLLADCTKSRQINILGPWAKRHGIKLTSRKIDGNGIRFWRIE